MITYPTDKLQKVLLSGACEQNGTPTPDNPVDIICNNGVLKVSPNLFNKDLVINENRYIHKGDGLITTPYVGVFRRSYYIRIKGSTKYYLGIVTSVASVAGLAFYDDTKTYISGLSLTDVENANNIITSPANAKYIRFSFNVGEGYNTNWQNTVYFVEGNQPLAEFIPYGQIYTDGTQEVVTDNLGNTANAERLLAVGDYKDTQEVLSGAVTRNVGIKVLDGTEDWSIYNRKFVSQVIDSVVKAATTFIFCSHLPQGTNGVRIGTGKGKLEMYPADMPNITTVEQWETWLANQYANGTPVIIVYPLAEPTTEQVTPQPLAGSSATVTAGSIDNLPIESSTIAELKKRYIGDKEVKRVYIGDNLVYDRNN